MTAEAEHFARLDALFQGALEQPEQNRTAWLDEECADEHDLRAEVAALLAEETGDCLMDLEGIVDAGWIRAAQEPSSEPSTTRPADTQDLPSNHRPISVADDPQQVGPYRVLGRLGYGGMATVYLAEREGEFSMPVALKRIRRGMDSEHIVGRLRLERQILARLIHPNICRIHDGGSDEDGRPYLVMEVIEGQRIDDWCIDQQLPLRQRLEAFESVCEAVDYAHQNLVLHRDLKPSNILVTPEGVPKLLDFGIAKLLRGEVGEDVEDRSMPTLTRMEERMLTPEYASPEQLLGMPLNTSSDIYSLGVLLYQLASGRLPHQPDGPIRQNPFDWAWSRKEQEAKPLSDAVRRALTENNPLTPAPDAFTVQHAVELNAVVAKALEPEPAKRYSSVRELAEDLRRLLDGRPVLARHQTWTYRTFKLIRRHRTSVAVAALVATSMMAAVVGTSWQASVARSERLRAEGEKRQAEAAVDFLIELFAVSDPYSKATLVAEGDPGSQPRGTAITARDLLDAGARRIGASLKEDPLARAEIQRSMAKAYLNLDLPQEARALLETSKEDLRTLNADSESADPEKAFGWAATLSELGDLEIHEGRFEEGRKILKEAERRFSSLGALGQAEMPLTLERLARLEHRQGNFADAEGLYKQALELHLKVHGEGSLEIAGARAGLAKVVQTQRRHAEAATIFQQVLADRAAVLGEDHPLVLDTLNDLAVSSSALDLPVGQKTYEDLLEKQRNVLGANHVALGATLFNLADNLNNQRRYDEAEQRLKEAWDLQPGETPKGGLASKILMLWGLVNESTGDLDDAAARYEQALSIRRELYPANNPEIVTTLLRLGRLLTKTKAPRAEVCLREALHIAEQSDPDFCPNIRQALASWALAGERWDEAEIELRKGLNELEESGRGTSRLAGTYQSHLAQALWSSGQAEKALKAAELGVQYLSEHLGAQDTRTVRALELLAEIKGSTTQAEAVGD